MEKKLKNELEEILGQEEQQKERLLKQKALMDEQEKENATLKLARYNRIRSEVEELLQYTPVMSTGVPSIQGVGAYGFVPSPRDKAGRTAAFAIVMPDGKNVMFTMDDIESAEEIPDLPGFWMVASRWDELYPVVAEDAKGQMLHRIKERREAAEKRQEDLNRETAAFSDAAEEEAEPEPGTYETNATCPDCDGALHATCAHGARAFVCPDCGSTFRTLPAKYFPHKEKYFEIRIPMDGLEYQTLQDGISEILSPLDPDEVFYLAYDGYLSVRFGKTMPRIPESLNIIVACGEMYKALKEYREVDRKMREQPASDGDDDAPDLKGGRSATLLLIGSEAKAGTAESSGLMLVKDAGYGFWEYEYADGNNVVVKKGIVHIPGSSWEGDKTLVAVGEAVCGKEDISFESIEIAGGDEENFRYLTDHAGSFEAVFISADEDRMWAVRDLSTGEVVETFPKGESGAAYDAMCDMNGRASTGA